MTRSTEATYYNVKRLHVVFLIASLALLAVTVWMLSADHLRQWKVYQRTFRDRVEPWMTEARILQQRDPDFAARQKELAAGLETAGRSVVDRELLDRFRGTVEEDAARQGAGKVDFGELEEARDRLAADPGAAARRALLACLEEYVEAAALRQENAQRRRRSRRAELDEARSRYEAGVGEGLPEQRLQRAQAKVDQIAADVKELDGEVERAAAHQRALERILGEITREEDAAAKALADHRAGLDRLGRALEGQKPGAAKRLLRSPLIDALGRPLAIEQIWLPELTIDYNFQPVARFDRCVTCHQGIDQTQPGAVGNLSGAVVEPMYRPKEIRAVELQVPDALREAVAGEKHGTDARRLASVYGLVLAERGMLDDEAPTILEVLPNSPAADARLMVGDVIRRIGPAPVANAEDVRRLLLEETRTETRAEGGPMELEICRGLPQPYCSHPRGDLFVGSRSPHPMTEFGCTICHDGQGSATEFRWASHTPNDPAQQARWRSRHSWFANGHWDYPMLPRRFAESRCLKCHHMVSDLEPSRRFPDPPAAKLLTGYRLIRENGCFGCHEIKGYDEAGHSIGPDMRLEPSLAEAEPLAAAGVPPGTMRKVGPSLREGGDQVEAEYLADRIADPRNFRPSSRMPRFYGLHEHLDGRSLADAGRFEAVEIEAIVSYLLAEGEAVEPAPAPAGVTEAASAERGKRLFEIHGCLACHQHQDFPQGQGTQGPELTNVGSKFTTEAGARWLASWIRDPVRHSPRTRMPNSLLEPIVLAAEDNEADATDAKVSDPVADIAAYLLECKGWQPKERRSLEDSDLDELALLHLGKASAGGRADAAEQLARMSRQEKLRYVGRQTIAKRGCYGCHDIAGFEDAQPIGPALSDWGRKQESLLAFEQVHRFVDQQAESEGGEAGDDPDRGFYTDALRAHRREGFIWQKLRSPRSFDFRKAQNNGYNEWLTMGQFQLDREEREAIVTFVLGLVAEPPPEKYVNHGDARRRAIAEGRKVLDTYACAECHTLEMERWGFEFDPQQFEAPPAAADYEFLRPHFSAEELAASMQTDNRGLGHAEVVGMPRVDADGELLVVDEDVDEDDNDVFQYGFTLWEPAAIGGEVCAVGGADVLIWDDQITAKRAPLGGAFARLLYPVALAEARAAGASTADNVAWGWLPPPLVDEGAKVRPGWLYEYLLAPTPIRPASMLRMPRYNMSAAEAGKLVDYFAAVSGTSFPYHSESRGGSDQAAQIERRHPGRLGDALKLILASGADCAKCHLFGDYSPGGEIQTTLAPNLDHVHGRIREEYLRRWLASPRSVLPYAVMTVNFPPTGKALEPELFGGDCVEQLDAVMDLLLNYDWYLKRRSAVRELVPTDTKTKPGQGRQQQR